MKQEEPILVAIHCLVYNHEPYLRDCFEGFVMQKTNFRFVAIVHEDCSTDNSAAIIREYEAKYPDIFRPIYETENQYSKGECYLDRIMRRALNATGCKYIAFCEGDDYWTDPYKLQIQVDFLETHQDYNICCHGYKIYNVASWEQTEILYNEKEEGFEFSNVENCEKWYTKTLTILFRSEVYNAMPDMSQFRYWRDAHIMYYLLKKGKGYYLPFVGGTYREHSGGIYYSLPSYQKNLINFKVYGEIYLYNKDDQELVRLFSKRINEIMEYVVWRIRLQDYSPEVKENLSAVSNLLWKDKKYKTLVTWYKQIIIAAIKGSKCYQNVKNILKNPA